MGVRYNAEKKKIGNYHSTPIYSFRCKCHLCSGWFEIQTDPKVCDRRNFLIKLSGILPACRIQDTSLLLGRDRKMRTGIPKTTAGLPSMVRATATEEAIAAPLNSVCRYRGQRQTRRPSGRTREIHRITGLLNEGPSPPVGGDTGYVGQIQRRSVRCFYQSPQEI